MRPVGIAKACSIGEFDMPSVTIVIDGDFEQFVRPDSDLKAHDDFYEAQATTLFEALKGSLPGGTLDRLMVKLMQNRISHFRVPL